jgi:hypothetical protein
MTRAATAAVQATAAAAAAASLADPRSLVMLRRTLQEEAQPAAGGDIDA